MTLKLKEMHFCSYLAHHSQWIDENWVKGRMWQDPEEHLVKAQNSIYRYRLYVSGER